MKPSAHQPPPIPQLLSHLPTVAGLAVPWFTQRLPDGRYLFGALDIGRAEQALRRRLCQICGRPLEHPLVFVMCDRDIARMISAEAACHTVCARYSEAGCPMLNGAMDRYRRSSPVADLLGIGVAVSYGDPYGRRAARAAEPWNLVYASGYTVITDTAVNMLAARLSSQQILRIRPIRAGASQ